MAAGTGAGEELGHGVETRCEHCGEFTPTSVCLECGEPLAIRTDTDNTPMANDSSVVSYASDSEGRLRPLTAPTPPPEPCSVCLGEGEIPRIPTPMECPACGGEGF